MQHEDNKLIMEFMGLKVDSKNFVKIPAHGYIHRGNYQEEFNTSSVRYHKSWDWLMEVVEKIANLDSDDAIRYRMTHMYSVNITGNGTTIKPSMWAGDKWMIRHNSYNRRLQNTYSAIVEFINFYNLHKINLWSKKM